MSMRALLSPTGRTRRGGVAPPTPPSLDLSDAEESTEEGGAENAEQGAGNAELEPGRVESDAILERTTPTEREFARTLIKQLPSTLAIYTC
ncbi:hypothetical protein CGCSCA5_v010243 [Colletotrichum siamense]|nr:hypothetical protein CGCSCA5_v010243 [Colletotrichum siamense]